MEFKGKTAISTGAASGMGLLFAQNFASLGGNVLMCDVNEEVLTEKVNEINAKDGGRAIGVICDVRDYVQVSAARDKAIEAFGSIDVLANFAGGASCRIKQVKEQFKDYPVDVLDWGIDVNLKGPLYFTRSVIGQMIEQKSGVLIYLGSIVGAEGGGGMSCDYSVAKSGLMTGMVKSMAQYGAQYGIRSVCVSPGPVLTREAMAKMKTLIGRAAEPIEVVNLILYLASDQAASITGVNIPIDGGRSALKV